MNPVPWSHVNSWHCSCCGLCCKDFEVVLQFDEWLNLIRKYGVGVTKTGLNRFFLGKKDDGTCMFLYNSFGRWFCGLQNTKPMACRLWPIKVVNRPKYGFANEAAFNYNGRQLFVYIDPSCPEISFGRPSQRMTYHVIPEFIEIALGSREKQMYSTSSVHEQHGLFSQNRRKWNLTF